MGPRYRSHSSLVSCMADQGATDLGNILSEESFKSVSSGFVADFHTSLAESVSLDFDGPNPAAGCWDEAEEVMLCGRW